MIRAEDVADLREGDVVEFRIDDWPQSHAIRATLQINDLGALVVPIPGDSQGGYWIRTPQGQAFDGENRTLTVVSRAPRLYVNHTRTEPAMGDVVRNADDDDAVTWTYWADADLWLCSAGGCTTREDLPARLRLLVDGETGRCVP